MSIRRSVPRRRQGPLRLVNSPLFPAIKELWVGSSPYRTVVQNTRPTPTGVSQIQSAAGPATSITTGLGNGLQLTSNPDTLFPASGGCTILVLRRSRDTTLRDSTLFGYQASATDRVLCHAPFTDGNLYFDYGNATSGSGRISATYAKSTSWEVVVLVAGPTRGREIWRNGVLLASNTSATASRPSNTTGGFRIGGWGPSPGATNASADNDDVALFCIAHAEWTPAAIRALSQVPTVSPWKLFAPASRRTVVQAVAGSGVSGTLATTNANDTSAASGSTTITGTVARTNANDTSAASGSTTITGTLARTNANDTSAASGSVGQVSGSVARTNANDTSAASGTTTIVGTLARTNANDTSAASGWAGTISGTLARTNANDTAAAAGTVVGGIAGSTGAVVFIPLRFASGRWSATGITATADLVNARSRLPAQREPAGYFMQGGQRVDVYMTPRWYTYQDILANVKLGGEGAPTLGDVVATALSILAQSQDTQATVSAVAQQTQSAVNSIAATIEVVQANALTGAEQIPRPQMYTEIP